MKPTVGRIVHYMNLGDADGRFPPETQAAIITGVDAANIGEPVQESRYDVDLHIFYLTGQFDMQKVPFSPTAKRGHWTWPPP